MGGIGMKLEFSPYQRMFNYKDPRCRVRIKHIKSQTEQDAFLMKMRERKKNESNRATRRSVDAGEDQGSAGLTVQGVIADESGIGYGD